jgi:type II secretory pathway pseudopilin PulG
MQRGTLSNLSGLSPSSRTAHRPRSASAFSLVELLVVIFIIGIVIAIIVPALGSARNVSRKSATEALMANLNSATSSFSTDNAGKQPGYFSAREMGHTDNANRGMTSMENIMIDLAGGLVGTGATAPAAFASDPDLVSVSPLAAQASRAWIKTSLVGSTQTNSKSYMQLNDRNYIAQTDGKQVGVAGHTAAPDAPQLKDLVDSWGNPILAWQLDEAANSNITQVIDFARVDSTAGIARFYWNSNAGFLRSTQFGKRNLNQDEKSILGSTASDIDRSTSLAGILGNPSAALDVSQNFDRILPSIGRGKVIFHSAGSDGIFLSRDDRGSKIEARPENQRRLVYGLNFKNTTNQPNTNANGQPASIDLSQQFDDLIQQVSN